MASSQPMPIPEPMNASPHHSKVKVSITLADRMVVAGGFVAGKLEMECRADKGLGIGVIMIELFATQELTSRDHSATSTFIHSKRLFQGPGLPPSNAVQEFPQPGAPVLPPNYYQARRGISTFLFRIPIPEGSPSSIMFGSGLAKVRYELRATVGVVWKDERRLVVDKQPVEVVAAYPYEEIVGLKEPEGVVIGENGKFWMHGQLVGPVVVAGESACVELHVKNHSNKKNTGLSLSLNRTLILPGLSKAGKQALELTDTLTHVPFRGPEYIIPPGAEGIAQLVFDVPKHSRGIKGGTLEGDEVDPPRHTESLFEIRCTVDIKMSMGFGNKDLLLSVPVSIVHPKVVPPPKPTPFPYAPPTPAPMPYHYPSSPVYPQLPMSPQLPFAVDHQQNQVWIPPPVSPQPYYSPSAAYRPQPPLQQTYMAVPHYIVRPSSAGGNTSYTDPYALPSVQHVSGLPPPSGISPVSTPDIAAAQVRRSMSPVSATNIGAEEGKGPRALRVSHHLRVSSRTRSVSPQSHRFPLPVPPPQAIAASTSAAGTPVRHRGLPQPPVVAAVPLSPSKSLSPAVPRMVEGMVHSPRPQLTPKQSFSNDRPKSERVETLERMAKVIAAQTKDLSGDIPKDDELHAVAAVLQNLDSESGTNSPQENPEVVEGQRDVKDLVELNKTLPAPPVPTRPRIKPVDKPQVSTPTTSTRPAIETIFDPPLPDTPQSLDAITPRIPFKDRTPPTPTLTAIASRYPRAKLNNFLKTDNTESGLDALERKLLEQVGTRKWDEVVNGKKDDRPDVRDLMGMSRVEESDGKDLDGEEKVVGKVSPIDIPAKAKSPEPLNDESAISSLTLGNGGLDDDHKSADGELEEHVLEKMNGRTLGADLGMGGNDSDMEAKTHRGGSVSGDERRSWDGRAKSKSKATSKHKREEADGAVRGTTPTRLSTGSGKSGKSKEKDKERRGGKKKEKDERVKARTDAKGRVAAWLGGIDPEQAPEEEVIPPSPSVVRHLESIFAPEKTDSDLTARPDTDSTVSAAAGSDPSGDADKIHEARDVSTAPNPRSSGFLPVGTLRKDTVQRQINVSTRDATIVRDSKHVMDLWASGVAETKNVSGHSPEGVRTPRIPVTIPARPTPQSIRTDRRVSPPSKSPNANQAAAQQRNGVPIPESRNVWQLPEPIRTVKSQERVPPPVPAKSAAALGRPPVTKADFDKPLDPEVKYNIRSARGGRGGKVTSVAQMWASVAAGIQTSQSQASTSKPGLKAPELPRKPSHNGRFASPVISQSSSKPGPSLPGKIALPGLSSPPMGNSTKPVAGSVPVPSRQEPQKPKPSVPELKEKPEPARVPKTLPNVTPNLPVPIRPTTSSSGKATDRPNISPAPGLFAGDFKMRTSGKTTPTANNKSTPSSSGEPGQSKDFSSSTKFNGGLRGGLPAATRNNAVSITKPVKSMSVPAVISSSHAVPVLSSTASLARPPGTSPAPRLTANANPNVSSNAPARDKPTKERGWGPSIPSKLVLGQTTSSPPPASPTKSPPPELAFGQARLRDLIRKYQAQPS